MIDDDTQDEWRLERYVWTVLNAREGARGENDIFLSSLPPTLTTFPQFLGSREL